MAYKNFHEQVQFHNTIGKGLGQPHWKKCSIPQGCPLSMTIVAYLFHPWVKLMRAHGVKPRGLADDLTITAFGANHEKRVRAAFAAHSPLTRCFLPQQTRSPLRRTCARGVW